MRRRYLACVMILAVSTALADSLVVEGPNYTNEVVGSNLVMQDNDVMIVADDYATHPVDRIMRSSFDASFWYWQVIVDGALAEGWGMCVLLAGPPDVYLRCDS